MSLNWNSIKKPDFSLQFQNDMICCYVEMIIAFIAIISTISTLSETDFWRNPKYVQHFSSFSRWNGFKKPPFSHHQIYVNYDNKPNWNTICFYLCEMSAEMWVRPRRANWNLILHREWFILIHITASDGTTKSGWKNKEKPHKSPHQFKSVQSGVFGYLLARFKIKKKFNTRKRICM